MIDLKKLTETAEFHLKRGDSIQIDPAVVKQLAQASALNERLLTAAEKYYTSYCQDEASDFGVEDTGCSKDQHKDAAELRDAIAAAKRGVR